MIPGIGRQNLLRHLRALLRDHEAALQRAYDEANVASHVAWKLRGAAAELLKETSADSKAERVVLELLATQKGYYGSEIWDRLADARGLNELIAPPVRRRRR